jgi:hypothetical protein
VRVVVPETLTDRERQLFENLREASAFHPRERGGAHELRRRRLPAVKGERRWIFPG